MNKDLIENQENEIVVFFSDDSNMPAGNISYPPLPEHEQEELDLALDEIMSRYCL